jgi:hypothetical protein
VQLGFPAKCRSGLVGGRQVGTKALVAIGIWGTVIAAGFYWLAAYEFRQGLQASAPPRWPASSQLALDPTRWTLVQFLHPYCPCSDASREQVADLISVHGGKLRIYLIFCKPEGTPADWEKTALWRRATLMEKGNVVCDEFDSERRCFGALTSGQAFLYDSRGQLRFSGGITSARGRVGPSPGRRAIESLLEGVDVPLSQAPVYGCPLIGPEP